MDILNELAERIGKRRAEYAQLHSNPGFTHLWLNGADRGFFATLLEIADMKREQDAKRDSRLDSPA